MLGGAQRMTDYSFILPIEQKRFNVGGEDWLTTVTKLPNPSADDIDRIVYKVRFDRQDKNEETRTLDLITSEITLATDKDNRQKDAIWEKIKYFLESGEKKGRIEHFG
jgi:hypothetical protein